MRFFIIALDRNSQSKSVSGRARAAAGCALRRFRVQAAASTGYRAGATGRDVPYRFRCAGSLRWKNEGCSARDLPRRLAGWICAMRSRRTTSCTGVLLLHMAVGPSAGTIHEYAPTKYIKMLPM